MRFNSPLDAEEKVLLTRLGDLVGIKTGLLIDSAHWFDVHRAVAVLAAENGLDWRSCARDVLDSPDGAQFSALIDHLTIGETYFFRDDALFAALREQVLTEVITQRRASGERSLRLWSAGCSSGEEAYSVAIELVRLLPDWRAWSIRLLATDINRRFLDKAMRGIYAPWSLRTRTPAALAPFLKAVANDRFEVLAELRQLVSFAPLNLAADDYPSSSNGTSDMDVILCRHVLMYLRPDVARAVIDRLARALAAGGWLITSSIEASLVEHPELKAVRLHDLVLFRKRSAAWDIAPNNSQLVKAHEPARDDLTRVEKTFTAMPNRAKRKTPAVPAVEAVTDHSAAAQLAAARSLANRGRLDEARTACERAIALDKLNSEAHFLAATISLELADIETAESALQRALYLDSDFIAAHVTLGMLALQGKREADAARHFRNARELLRALPADAAVPSSDNLTASQLSDMIDTLAATG